MTVISETRERFLRAITGVIPAERVIENRPLLRCQRLVEGLDRRRRRLQPLEPGRQELLLAGQPLQQG